MAQAEDAIKALSEKATSTPVIASYVIQNEKFNDHDGDKGWVCDVADAKFYNTAKKAEKK